MISQNHGRGSAPKCAGPASRRPASAVSPLPAARAWLNADIDLARLGGVNVLLTGPARLCDRVIERIRPDLPRPVVSRRGDRPLVLPPPEQAGTLVLRGVDRVSRGDQERLLAWLDVSQVKVISLSSEPLIAFLSTGEFLAPLYYRLNIVCIELCQERP